MSNYQPLLDQYLDNLENLSPELIRNFKLIQDLDSRVRDILIEIDTLKETYKNNFKTYCQETRLIKIKEIDDKYEKVKQFSDEKVQLANQTYELIDKYICKLDTDLGRFEGELNQTISNNANNNKNDAHTQSAQAASAAAVLNISDSNPNNDETLDVTLKKKKKKTDKGKPKKDEKTEQNTATNQIIAVAAVNPEMILADMPVDPNEPIYCICKQVSFGEMIGCDDNDCEIEWFHLGCVGLNALNKPGQKSKWYCPICIEKRKN